MRKLGNDTVTLLIRDKTSSDELGIAVNTVARIDVPWCSVQPATDYETNTNTDITVAKWRAYCPPTADVLALETKDAVEYLGVVYEEFGDPQPWTNRHADMHHSTLILRKSRG